MFSVEGYEGQGRPNFNFKHRFETHIRQTSLVGFNKNGSDFHAFQFAAIAKGVLSVKIKQLFQAYLTDDACYFCLVTLAQSNRSWMSDYLKILSA